MKRRSIFIIAGIWTLVMLVVLIGCLRGPGKPGDFSADSIYCHAEGYNYIVVSNGDEDFIYKADEAGKVVKASALNLNPVGKDAELVGLSCNESGDSLYGLAYKEDESGRTYHVVLFNNSLRIESVSAGFSLNADETVQSVEYIDGAMDIVTVDRDSFTASMYAFGFTGTEEEDSAASVSNLNPIQEAEPEKYDGAVFSAYSSAGELVIVTDPRMRPAESFYSMRDMYNTLHVPLGCRLAAAYKNLVTALIVWLAGLVILAVLYRMVLRRLKTAGFAFALEIAFIIGCAAVILVTAAGKVDVMRDARVQMATNDIYKVYDRLADPEKASDEDYQKAIGKVRKENITSVMSVSINNGFITAGSNGSAGLNIDNIYGSEISLIIDDAYDRNNASIGTVKTNHGEETVIAVVDRDNPVSTTAVVASVDQGTRIGEIKSAALTGIWVFIVLFVIFTGVVIASIWVREKDIKIIVDNVKKLTEGRNDLKEPLGRSYAIKVVNSGVKEIAYQMDKLKISSNASLESVSRFLPRNVEKILGKKSIDDVRFGDSARISGSLAYLTINVKVRTGLTLEDAKARTRAFVDYRNENDGILLANDSRMRKFKMLTRDENTQVISSTVNLINKVRDTGTTIFLFHDTFTYGVAGTDEQSLVYLISPHDELVENCSKWFAAMNLPFVVSEDVKNREDYDGALRYIGYLPDADHSKVYEVLDANPEKVRKSKIYMLDDFEEAIEMFYSKDYYLARTAFSDILKVVPEDTMSKWYLFECEKHLSGDRVSDDTALPII